MAIAIRASLVVAEYPAEILFGTLSFKKSTTLHECRPSNGANQKDLPTHGCRLTVDLQPWVRTRTCYWLELSHVTLTCRLYDFDLISMNIDLTYKISL